MCVKSFCGLVACIHPPFQSWFTNVITDRLHKNHTHKLNTLTREYFVALIQEFSITFSTVFRIAVYYHNCSEPW